MILRNQRTVLISMIYDVSSRGFPKLQTSKLVGTSKQEPWPFVPSSSLLWMRQKIAVYEAFRKVCSPRQGSWPFLSQKIVKLRWFGWVQKLGSVSVIQLGQQNQHCQQVQRATVHWMGSWQTVPMKHRFIRSEASLNCQLNSAPGFLFIYGYKKWSIWSRFSNLQLNATFIITVFLSSKWNFGCFELCWSEAKNLDVSYGLSKDTELELVKSCQVSASRKRIAWRVFSAGDSSGSGAKELGFFHGFVRWPKKKTWFAEKREKQPTPAVGMFFLGNCVSQEAPVRGRAPQVFQHRFEKVVHNEHMVIICIHMLSS